MRGPARQRASAPPLPRGPRWPRLWVKSERPDPGVRRPTSSSRRLCSFCCSMRFCLSASSCRLYSSCSRSCCSCSSCCLLRASERSLFSCCSLRKSRRSVDSPGTLTMELQGEAGLSGARATLPPRPSSSELLPPRDPAN